ncbi:hypothetical protein D0863_10314 [Hortaea werneckii]|uniref:Uncharacterized protein n=1 Tax=Hortaea werneckii TaxID=91943 RepID=A0A3M7DHE6_HORWE|nr:hypothetical protein D0863_10314 [Hortaea werneckii]
MPNQSNLGAFTALYSSPHTSHRKHFSPVEYRDLNRTDISLLAPILAVEGATNPASPIQTTKHQISQLPSHLQATIPWLSTFCRHHRKLNSLPLISLWNAIRDEVLSELATVWTNVDLSPAHAHFIDRIRHFPRFDPRQVSKRCCAACSLASMAGDNDLLIAVGAVVLAGLARRNWRKSKRALFLQVLLGGQTSAKHAEGSVLKMLQLAAEWREIRCCFWESRRGGAVGRPGEVVRNGPSQRPARDARQEGHVAVVLGCVGDEKKSADPVLCPGCSKDHRTGACGVEGVSRSRGMSRPPTVPAKSTPSPSPFAPRQEDLPTSPGASSSIYSDHEAEDATPIDASSPALLTSAPAPAARTHTPSFPSSSLGEAPPSICGESTIINLYRHSIFPPSPAPSSSPPSSVHPPTNQKTQHVKFSKPRHSLAPIWIPRPYYDYGGGRGEVEREGQGESGLATSALWRRRTARFNEPSRSPPGFGVEEGKGVKASQHYDVEEDDVRGQDVVAGAKADACWVPGMAAGKWI